MTNDQTAQGAADVSAARASHHVANLDLYATVIDASPLQQAIAGAARFIEAIAAARDAAVREREEARKISAVWEKAVQNYAAQRDDALIERDAAVAALAKAEGALRRVREWVIRNADLHTSPLVRFDLTEAIQAIDAALTPAPETNDGG